MMSSPLRLLTALFFCTLNFGPGQAQNLPLPTPSAGLMPNATQGKRLFEKNCAACHGQNLRGTEQGPPLLDRIYEPSHHGDASFQMAVRYGARAHHWRFGDMKPVPGVSADEVAHITAYVRQQQRAVGIN